MMSEQYFRPQGLIFDLDGTLVDNMPLHNRAWMEFLTERGVRFDPATFHQQTAGGKNVEILRYFLGADLSDEEVERSAQEKEIRYRRLAAELLLPLPGLLPFLQRARQAGLRLGLATLSGRENRDFLLPRLELADFFDTVVGDEDVTRSKPDPQAFLLAAERLGLPPERCLAFEDSYKGIQAAHRAGMPVVAVLTELSEAQALAQPGVIAAINDYTQPNGFARW